MLAGWAADPILWEEERRNGLRLCPGPDLRAGRRSASGVRRAADPGLTLFNKRAREADIINLQQEFSRYKVSLLQKSPFYGTLLMHIPIIEEKHVNTAATDGRRIYYNPRFMASLNAQERRFVLMHELFHILLMHPSRCNGRDQELYNVAADMVVNDHCRQLSTKLGMQAPKNGIYGRIRYDQSTEELYAIMEKDNQAWLKRVTNQIKLRRQYQYGNAPADVALDGTARDLMPVADGASGDALSKEIRDMVREAAKGDPGMGSMFVPAQLLGLTESRRLPWKQLFKSFMREAEDDDASYATPERKYLHMDLILPGHCESEGHLCEVWAFVDSSGSITRDEMSQFLTQLYRISKEFKCTMHIAYWDTAVTDVYRNVVSEKKILDCLPQHSGGTNINCVYRWIRDNRVKPDVMLILTDGAFGTLQPENYDQKLQRCTILVLSNNQCRSAGMDKIGRIATLEGA